MNEPPTKYCDDPDHCTYADCPTAFCDRNGKRETQLSFSDAVRIARGCMDYGGGYRSDQGQLEIFWHGIKTVINALEAAEKNGLADTQCAALWRMGKEATK